ncbi:MULTISPECIES: MFS transporter [unclassified Streptomyces]|jgi:sugar phosphate permease|uniref:MFS transporter n=1 Tax=unclassified Streptomyces TaxID=2593676 RepID=UPI00081B8680|nr:MULTISPECIES: MFS transporter [unclassified Streptomyces]MYQ84565.1 MFS transporter [Streptomyces sp. SID4936]SCD88437.1 Major Facilitator Superfamily protein [Streptomyces sp. DvalAA-43]
MPSQPSSPPALDVPADLAAPVFDRRRAWLVTALIVTFMIVNFADKSVLGLAADPIMDELGISHSAYGLISSSYSILFSLSGLVVGFFSARVSSRVLLFVMCLVWGLAQLPVLIVTAVPALVAGRVLLGAAEGPATPMSMHALYKWFPVGRRGLPSALQISGAALGTLIAAPVVTWLITQSGWRSAFAALAVTSLVWSAVWWFVGRDGPYDQPAARVPARAGGPVRIPAGTGGPVRVPAEPGGPVREPAETEGPVRVPYRRLLLSGTVIGSVTSAFGASWAMALSQAWLPSYLKNELTMSPGTAAAVLSAVSALSFVLLLALSPAVDRLTRRGVSLRLSGGVPQGLAVGCAGVAMAVFPFVGPLPVRLALIAVAFAVHSIAFPLHYMTAAAVVPASRRGALFGIVAATGTLPGLLAPSLTGRLLDTAPSAGAGYAQSFALAAVVMITCGAVAVCCIRPARDAARLGTLRGRPEPVSPDPVR